VVANGLAMALGIFFRKSSDEYLIGFCSIFRTIFLQLRRRLFKAYKEGDIGGTQNRNTAKKIVKNRNTAAKIDRIPKLHFEMPGCCPP